MLVSTGSGSTFGLLAAALCLLPSWPTHLLQPVSAAPLLAPRNNDGYTSKARVSSVFKSLVVFGDSFSDDGHGAWLVSNGTWPADPAYYGHHFSNGPTWAQVTADPSALDLTLLDYAVGGATANNANIAGFTGPNSTIAVPASQDQIDVYLKLYKPQPNDIFVVYIGANDAFFSTNASGSTTAKLISNQVKQLVENGAKHVLLASYPDLNLLPFSSSTGPSYNDFLLSYSTELRAGLRTIADSYSSSYSSVKIKVIDVDSLFQDIVQRPKDYGFDPKVLAQSCLKGAYASEGVPRSVCKNPDSYIFWDPYHPTRRAHKLVAGLFIDAIKKWSQAALRIQS